MRQQRLAVEGIELAANVAGDAGRPAILLLHGWPHSKALFDAVVDPLGERFHVLAFDLPAIGDSVGPPASAEKESLARVLLGAAETICSGPILLAGIDVGGMVAFAAARRFPGRVAAVAIGNTAVPGIDPWDEVVADPRIWHFAFHAVPGLPELLVRGHERAYFDFFFDALGSKQRPLPDGIRQTYTDAYSRPEALKAGFDWYRAFAADAESNGKAEPIATPMLYFRGDADGRNADAYVRGLRMAGARNVCGETLAGTAEFAPVEAPERFVAMLTAFAEGRALAPA